MKTTLYKISSEFNELLTLIEEAEGEITEEMAQALEINEKELQRKALDYNSVIISQKAFITTIDEEIKRLQALKKQRQNLIKRLENNLLNAVNLFGEFVAGQFTFKTRKSTVVEVEDVNGLPSKYKVVKVTEAADKAAIKAAIKAGETIKGCSLKENINLSIK